MERIYFLFLLFSFFSITACGGGGNNATNDNNSSSESSDKVWGKPVLIENQNFFSAVSPQIVSDRNGNTIAIWSQWDGRNYNTWTNRFSASSGTWGNPTQLVSLAKYAQIAVDSLGNAFLLWCQYTSVWVNRYDVSTGQWGSATLIASSNVGDMQSTKIAIDRNGNAMAVWRQSSGGSFVNYRIMASYYEVDRNQWGASTDLTDYVFGSGAQSKLPQVSFDFNGNAHVVWDKHDGRFGTYTNIWSNRYDVVSGEWDGAKLLETENLGNSYNPQIDIDDSGNAIAVWPYSNGTTIDIWSNRYDANTKQWGTAEPIETNNASLALNPKIFFDTNGNAISLWVHNDGNGYFYAWYNRYDVSLAQWGNADLLYSEYDKIGQINITNTVDANGNLFVVWRQHIDVDRGIRSVVACRYDTSTGQWDTPVTIGTGEIENPKVAIDANGNVTVVWSQYDGFKHNIWANRFQ